MAVKILHCANARLGATFTSLGHHGREHRTQLLDTLSGLAYIARIEQVHAVLVSGDLFDCAVPSARTLDAVQGFFQSIHEAGIEAIVLPGARDPQGIFDPAPRPDGRSLCPHAAVLGPACPVLRLETLDLEVRAVPPGLPSPAESAPEPRLSVDPVGSLIGIGLTYVTAHGGHDLAELARSLADYNLRYVAIGGDARYAVHVEGGTTLCSPGIPEPLEWGQERGSVAVVQIADDGAVTVEQRRCGTHRLSRREFEVTPANARHITGIIHSMADQTLALEIVLTGNCPFRVLINPAAIEEELAPAFFHLRIVDRTTLLLTSDDLQSLPQGTIVANFARVMNGRMRDVADDLYAGLEREAYQLGLSLLQGASVPR
jgi:hypothetical protein